MFQWGKAVCTLLSAEILSVCIRGALCKDQEFSQSREAVCRFQEGLGREKAPLAIPTGLSEFSFFSVDCAVVKHVSYAKICILPFPNNEQLHTLDMLLCCMGVICPSRDWHHQLPLPSDFQLGQPIGDDSGDPRGGERGQVFVLLATCPPSRSRFGSGCDFLSEAVGQSCRVSAWDRKDILMELGPQRQVSLTLPQRCKQSIKLSLTLLRVPSLPHWNGSQLIQLFFISKQVSSFTKQG